MASSGSRPTEGARAPLTLRYLGVAGWEIACQGKVLLLDPYYSRPALEGPIHPDLAAIARHRPEHVDAILIGHSHIDHVLDAPTVARDTGALILGSASTAALARASGIPPAQIVPVRGGEDYQFEGFSVRVVPSLHSALGHKTVIGANIAADPKLPLSFDDYAEGGTFAYLVRIGGHVLFLASTANFIEREVDGLRPDVAIVATGLRDELFDYTGRLMRALGRPRLILTNHFDDWRAPPERCTAGRPAPSDDLAAFTDEVHAVAPATRVIGSCPFEPITLP